MQTPSTTQHEQTYAADRNDAEARPQELSELDLEHVVGGKVTMQDIHFTATVSKASPTLFL
jgi:type VI protein secretion system component Hcp